MTKQLMLFFESGNWYLLDFQHITAVKIPEKVIEVLVDENETQRKAAIFAEESPISRFDDPTHALRNLV